MGVVDMASEWAQENLAKRDPFRVERRNLTEGLMLIDGNTAGALGSIFGGVTVVGVVPDHPRHLLRRRAERVAPEASPDRGGQDTPTPSSRPKTNWPRLAWWSARAGRARAR